jgi:hypothetical protein
MPLLSITRSFIDVDVADRTPGVKQRARWRKMIVTQDPLTGELVLELETWASQFADEAGAYGPALVGNGIVPYRVPLRGDNDTAVDPETGQVRYMRTTETPQQWLELLAAKPEPLLLQGDWFAGLMDKMGITPLIRSFMEQANHPPFSKFS